MESKRYQPHDVSLFNDTAPWPVMICVLGNFRLLALGELVPTRAGGKSEAFLSLLALHYNQRVQREQIIQSLWPERESTLARNSLYNLVHHLNKLLGSTLQGAGLVLQEDGYYRLNIEAGIGVDMVYFDRLIAEGDQQLRAGDMAAASRFYDRATQLYKNDMHLAADAQSIIEGERLRARYLTLLAQLAEYHYQKGTSSEALAYLWRLLARDPYREDAHRLVMRCYIQRGERAAALHHYHICENILRTEFNAPPEVATIDLYNQIRFHPNR